MIRQFCRKLLGYALGRGIQLSDLPLLEEMEQTLEEERLSLLSAALESVVASRQFREIRGRDAGTHDRVTDVPKVYDALRRAFSTARQIDEPDRAFPAGRSCAASA